MARLVWTSLLALLFISCSSGPEVTQKSLELEITELSATKKSHFAKQNLKHLINVYHLDPLLFTKKVHIDPKSQPKAKPVLTINTKYGDRPSKLLGQFLHEQFHWWLALNPKKTSHALKALTKLYPHLPQGIKHAQIITCCLEYEALTYYLGKGAASSVITDFIKEEKSRSWSYGKVLSDAVLIKKILEKYRLLPAPL